MTHGVRIRRPTVDATRHETSAETRDPHLVRGYGLLAENMPSVLKQLRPMDISSHGMLRYLDAQVCHRRLLLGTASMSSQWLSEYRSTPPDQRRS